MDVISKISQPFSSACPASISAFYRMLLFSSQKQSGIHPPKDRPENTNRQWLENKNTTNSCEATFSRITHLSPFKINSSYRVIRTSLQSIITECTSTASITILFLLHILFWLWILPSAFRYRCNLLCFLNFSSCFRNLLFWKWIITLPFSCKWLKSLDISIAESQTHIHKIEVKFT